VFSKPFNHSNWCSLDLLIDVFYVQRAWHHYTGDTHLRQECMVKCLLELCSIARGTFFREKNFLFYLVPPKPVYLNWYEDYAHSYIPRYEDYAHSYIPSVWRLHIHAFPWVWRLYTFIHSIWMKIMHIHTFPQYEDYAHFHSLHAEGMYECAWSSYWENVWMCIVLIQMECMKEIISQFLATPRTPIHGIVFSKPFNHSNWCSLDLIIIVIHHSPKIMMYYMSKIGIVHLDCMYITVAV
jgi:hypothetical protein